MKIKNNNLYTINKEKLRSLVNKYEMTDDLFVLMEIYVIIRRILKQEGFSITKYDEKFKTKNRY